MSFVFHVFLFAIFQRIMASIAYYERQVQLIEQSSGAAPPDMRIFFFFVSSNKLYRLKLASVSCGLLQCTFQTS